MKKRKIGMLGINVSYNSNFENLGKILSPQFQLDLLGNTNASQNIKEIYSIKNYTRIKGKNLFTWFIRDVINLWYYCRKEKPDIICSLQNPDFQGPLITIFGKLFGIKNVVRFSGGGFDTYKLKKGLTKLITYFGYNWFMRLMLFSDKIICMGEEQKQHLIKYGCKPEKIEILLQPIKEQLFVPPKNKRQAKLKLGWDLSKTYLLYVGSLQKRKGVDTFLKIIPQITDKEEDIVFVLVGRDDDDYTPEFKKLPSHSIKLIPEINHNKVVDFYQAADLLIHPALNEGFPKTVLEAAACGLPIIARDVIGVGRVADKVFKTDEELVDLLLHNNLKPTNKSKLAESFTWNTLSKKYINLFEKLR